VRWLTHLLSGYGARGDGGDTRHQGERCPDLTRRASVIVGDSWTRWYGETPGRPGTRLQGASFPRIATFCQVNVLDAGAQIVVIDAHLTKPGPTIAYGVPCNLGTGSRATCPV
jgi:hypothetical protein